MGNKPKLVWCAHGNHWHILFSDGSMSRGVFDILSLSMEIARSTRKGKMQMEDGYDLVDQFTEAEMGTHGEGVPTPIMIIGIATIHESEPPPESSVVINGERVHFN